ncbi:hypothetical protein ABF86_00405 [Nitrosomonas sp. GH22]|nr:hypothetical protein [Nitrosomonas sp. GH22]
MMIQSVCQDGEDSGFELNRRLQYMAAYLMQKNVQNERSSFMLYFKDDGRQTARPHFLFCCGWRVREKQQAVRF